MQGLIQHGSREAGKPGDLVAGMAPPPISNLFSADPGVGSDCQRAVLLKRGAQKVCPNFFWQMTTPDALECIRPSKKSHEWAESGVFGYRHIEVLSQEVPYGGRGSWQGNVSTVGGREEAKPRPS